MKKSTELERVERGELPCVRCDTWISNDHPHRVAQINDTKTNQQMVVVYCERCWTILMALNQQAKERLLLKALNRCKAGLAYGIPAADYNNND